MTNFVIHKNNTRGNADHGWLLAKHTFSFANYYDPSRMNFGALRVLNDDTISAGMGFSMHPHQNMEIITIPLSGAIKHKDSMGNSSIISKGEIQVMSAGTGVNHSEHNNNLHEELKLLQIWVIPNKENVSPRYDQYSLNIEDRKNKIQQILSPYPDDEGVWIHQNAWFYLTDFETDITQIYTLNSKLNGVYIFIISGNITIENQELNERDGMGIWNIDSFKITSNSNSEFLIMEVPMEY